jgi:hypothetical protein
VYGYPPGPGLNCPVGISGVKAVETLFADAVLFKLGIPVHFVFDIERGSREYIADDIYLFLSINMSFSDLQWDFTKTY